MNSRHDQVLRAALKAGHIGEDRPLAGFVDTAVVAAAISDLDRAFPDHFFHTFAAKANPMSCALALVRDHGMGCEAASPGELEQALRAGFPPEKIVYDEPAKTRGVLEKVLGLGISLNIDNFQEFERVRSIIGDHQGNSRIGFRINPQVGAGQISAMSTATATSKFGIALEDAGNREKIVEAYRANPWLTALHIHVGSQGCSLELMTRGIRKVVDLAEAINAAVGCQQVEAIDIGGGLPVNFGSEEVNPTFGEYAANLQLAAPGLFTGKYTVITEFGRSIFAKSGFIASRIEYTKVSGDRRIALSHAGAQVATRTVFMPGQWDIRLSVCDASGKAKAGNETLQDIAGPLCFAGDLVGVARMLPRIEPGDYVVLHDTGAYYFSNPFYYNALCAPAVYGVETGAAGKIGFSVWRQQQSVDSMLGVIG